VVETIRQIWGQAPTPPQFQLSRTVEQTWAKAIPPQVLPQRMGVKGVDGRETTTIKKVWEEQLPEKNPDPPPDPVFDSSAFIMMKTLCPRAVGKIPARKTRAQIALAKRAMRALAQQTSTPLKSDFIVLCPMKNELDKSASKFSFSCSPYSDSVNLIATPLPTQLPDSPYSYTAPLLSTIGPKELIN